MFCEFLGSVRGCAAFSGGAIRRFFSGFIRASALVAATLPAAGAIAGVVEREPWDVYQKRREALAQKHSDGIIVLFGYGGREAQAARSPFRQENNFYYLTGWNEPGASLLLLPANRKQEDYQEILFLPSRDRSAEAWHGPRAGPQDDGLLSTTGFRDVRDAETLAPAVEEALKLYSRVHSILPGHPSYAQQPEPDRTGRLEALAPGYAISDIRPTLAAMRAVKSEGEILLIQKAIDASIAAHRKAWNRTRPGMYEYQISGLMIGTMMFHGCLRPAYAPIVGSGPRALILHYINNTGRLKGGDLVLMDVGGEYGHYAADITRTVPATGRFTSRQKELYEIVLGAQKIAIASVEPGMRLSGTSRRSLYQIVRDSLDSQGKELDGNPLARYFTHSVGHHVGLGVHDPMNPHAPLEAGMVITIEPGLYIPEENIGIRIEDMVLVTENGARVLSQGLAKEAVAIETLMQKTPTAASQ